MGYPTLPGVTSRTKRTQSYPQTSRDDNSVALNRLRLAGAVPDTQTLLLPCHNDQAPPQAERLAQALQTAGTERSLAIWYGLPGEALSPWT